MPIFYYNRKINKIEEELVYGGYWVNLLYGTYWGQLLEKLLSCSYVSRFYGLLQSGGQSHKKVIPFIKKFNIKMDEYEIEGDKQKPYNSFNQFFIRRFREGVRTFQTDPKIMPAFCEARYIGFEFISEDQLFPVKGKFLSAKGLLDNEKWDSVFTNGPLIIARLCPVDYHRFHFPDDGTVLESYPIDGNYHSVNPVAFKSRPELFCKNKRHVSILQTKNFGKIAFIEVGALCVGTIIQTHKGNEFKRGDEKGYFLFGGSTVIILGEKGRWIPSQDILKYSSQGMEVYLELGNEVARSNF